MALHGAPPAHAEELRRDPRIPIPQGTALARMSREADGPRRRYSIGTGIFYDPQGWTDIIGSAGARTLIMVPMLQGGTN